MTYKYIIHSLIEPLEMRIAPAGIISISTDGKTAKWTDVDGDAATLKSSRGGLDSLLFTTDQSLSTGLLVTKLDLTNKSLFSGTSLTLSVLRNPIAGGDGTVNIGYLDATGVSLGSVIISGDLGRIDAGDPMFGSKTPPAIKSLKVHSMGLLDGKTLPLGEIQTSEIVGKVASINVRGSIHGALFNVTGGSGGMIDSLTIGGSLVGTGDGDSGRISTSGNIGTILIKGSILGGAGQHSGSIQAGGAIKSLFVGGNISGGRSDTPSTDGTGVVRSDASIGKATVVGSLVGGTQQDSGLISTAGDIGTFKIGGIIGGSSGTSSGGIFADGNALAITVSGDVLGGAADDSGVIRVSGKVGSLKLLGALKGGAGEGSGSIQLGTNPADTVGLLSIGRDVIGADLSDSGTIHLTGKVKSLKIKGSLHGSDGNGSGSLSLDGGAGTVFIGGDLAGGAEENSGRISAGDAIASLTISGNVLGGTADGTGSIISTATIDKLSIAGSVIGGDLSDTASADLTGSALIQAARIGVIKIGGALVSGVDYNSSSSIVNSAAIRVENNINKLTVNGGIFGNPDAEIFITARGQQVVPVNSRNDVAFGDIVIVGSVRFANILGGYDATTDATQAESNPNAQMKNVRINGDWVASNLIAGAAWSDSFGDGNDAIAAGVDSASINAEIGRVRVTGQIIGTVENANDHFGFVAQSISALTLSGGGKGAVTPPGGVLTPVGRLAVFLNFGKGNDNDPVSLRYNLASTLDVRVFEFI